MRGRRLGRRMAELGALVWLLGSVAWGGETLDAEGIRRAAWSRDLDLLLEARFEEEDLGLLASVLAGFRDERAVTRLSILASVPDLGVREQAAFALVRTPGGAAVLRDRLRVESDRGVREVLIRSLGRTGEDGDVALLEGLLVGRDRLAAATALGLMGNRDVAAASQAVPALLELLGRPEPRVQRVAAFALYRIDPEEVEEAAVAWLIDRLPRLGDEAARGWASAVALKHARGIEHRRLVRETLRAPYRLATVAVLSRLEPEELDKATWRELLGSEDAWVAATVADRVGRRLSAEDQARADVAAGRGGPRTRAAVMTLALAEDDPPLASKSAVALLEHATSGELDSLAMATDPIIRELVAEALSTEPSVHAGRLSAMLQVEPAPAVQLLLLQALAAVPSAAPRDRVQALATSGSFGVRGAALALALELGLSVEGELVMPGPERLLSSMDRVSSVAGAVVHTSDGDVTLSLHPEVAPLAVANFALLAEEGLFDGVRFHRVVPGFVVQTGDPRGDGMGGPGWSIPDELSDHPYATGALGMARAGPDTAGSQWFITTSPQPHLRGEYTWFGEVTRGLEVVVGLNEEDVVLGVDILRVPPTETTLQGIP